jgi:hypothetical protein
MVTLIGSGFGFVECVRLDLHCYFAGNLADVVLGFDTLGEYVVRSLNTSQYNLSSINSTECMYIVLGTCSFVLGSALMLNCPPSLSFHFAITPYLPLPLSPCYTLV